MRFFTFVSISFALLATSVLSAPTTALAEVEKFDGQVQEGSYIVKLKSNVTKQHHLDWLSQHLGSDQVTHSEWQKDLFNGFAGKSRHSFFGVCLSIFGHNR